MITDRAIAKVMREVAAKGRPRTLVDEGQYGDGRLMLLVRPKGSGAAGSWFAQYYRGDKKVLNKVGDLASMTPAQARERFHAVFVPAIREGKDPAVTVAVKMAPVVAACGTFGELVAAYVDDLRGRGKRSWRQAHWKLNLVVEAVGGDLVAAVVTREHLIPYLRDLHGQAPASAAKTRSYLAAAFGFGLKAGGSYTRGNVGDRWKLTSNPVLGIEADADANKPRDRWLSPAEVRLLWDFCVPYQRDSLLASAVLLRIATGQRSEEILRISRRKGVGGFHDKAAGTIEWPETKNGRPHIIPIPRQAAEILTLLEMMPSRSDYYFPCLGDPKRHAGSEALRYVVSRFLKANPSFEHFAPRDLRRTWKTLAGMLASRKSTAT